MPRKVPSPLRCHICNSRKILATGATQMLLVNGKKRLHSDVICANSHKWWSRHKAAHTLDRAEDAYQQSHPTVTHGPHGPTRPDRNPQPKTRLSMDEDDGA